MKTLWTFPGPVEIDSGLLPDSLGADYNEDGLNEVPHHRRSGAIHVDATVSHCVWRHVGGMDTTMRLSILSGHQRPALLDPRGGFLRQHWLCPGLE